MSDQKPGKRTGRRGSFISSRKRFFQQHFAPGGTKTDPLNILANPDISDEAPKDAGDPGHILRPRNLSESKSADERPHKKRKFGSGEEMKSPLNSPNKQNQKKKHHTPGSPAKRKEDKAKDLEEKEKREKETDVKKCKKEYFNNKFCYGNFDRYYGVRLNPGEKDHRMAILKKDWFEKKSILDIGCNAGFLTLSIAKEYEPRRILGIDIDEHLIGVARKNIRHYCDGQIPLLGKYPASFASTMGPVTQHQPRPFSIKFPDNVWFRRENYVLEQDEMLDMVEEEYDVILALSITKWIHLNWGDDGIRRFLRRTFKNLLPGGRLIIEPQPFESYRKRAKMTDKLKGNYSKIEFKPEDFEMWLLEEVGFESVEHLEPPHAKSKGFERGIDVYVKSLKPAESTPDAPSDDA